MLKNIAIIFGIVFIVVGILGFVPQATPQGMLLGYFHVNTAHNIVHLATGIIALWAGVSSAHYSKLFFQIFGIIYGIVALLGYWYHDLPVLGFIANNLADAILHTIIAVVALYLGFVCKEFCDIK